MTTPVQFKIPPSVKKEIRLAKCDWKKIIPVHGASNLASRDDFPIGARVALYGANNQYEVAGIVTKHVGNAGGVNVMDDSGSEWFRLPKELRAINSLNGCGND